MLHRSCTGRGFVANHLNLQLTREVEGGRWDDTVFNPGILMSELEERLDIWKLRLGRESDMLSATQQLGRVGLCVVSVRPWQPEDMAFGALRASKALSVEVPVGF